LKDPKNTFYQRQSFEGFSGGPILFIYEENHVPQQKRHNKVDMAANEQMHKWRNEMATHRTYKRIELKYNGKKDRHMVYTRYTRYTRKALNDN